MFTRNTLFRSFHLIVKERATLQTVKTNYHDVQPSCFVDMVLFKRNSHQENYITAAPDDKKVMQQDQNSTFQLARTQRQNSQLLEINHSLSQTHTDIGLLLTERQESDGDREIVTDLRALLDKNAAMSDIVIESNQGV